MLIQNSRQLYIEGLEPPLKVCAFSGHRFLDEDFSARKLRDMIDKSIFSGTEVFYCGMAVGFDLIAAECVLEKKRQGAKVRLVACIPCREQEKSYSCGDRERYAKILAECDEEIVLSEKYYKGCMLRRNAYMEERADFLISYCRQKTGGTAYTVALFKKHNKPVWNV